MIFAVAVVVGNGNSNGNGIADVEDTGRCHGSLESRLASAEQFAVDLDSGKATYCAIEDDVID